MTKIISLSDNAYKELEKLRTGPKDSFTKIIERITSTKKKSILRHAGTWKGSLPDISEIRKKSKMRDINLKW